MKRVGLTGGIGCGKTTVLREFQEIGIPTFSADEIAKKYYDEPDFKADIRSVFGDSVFLPDGSVDKKALARLVFAESELLSRLNALVHPRVLRDFETFCERYLGRDYVVFESAILYEHHLDQLVDLVVCVYLDTEERISRLLQRDKSSREQIEARINNQLPADEVMSRADYVILNYEGNPRTRQVQYIHNQIIKC